MVDISRRTMLAGAGVVVAGGAAYGLLGENGPEASTSNPFGAVIDKGLDFAKFVDGGYDRAFPDAEYEQRLKRVQALMAAQDLDMLYVTSPEGMCYFTGYQATWYRAHSTTEWPALAALVIHADRPDFIFYDTSEEYLVHKATAGTENRHWLPEDKLEDAEAGTAYIVNDLKQRGWTTGRVGMELWSYVPNPAISRMLQDRFHDAGAEVVDATRVIRAVRNQKSDLEIDYIKKAAHFADIGLKAIAEAVYPGVTQLELLGVGYAAMMKAGGELPGIYQGVMSGPMASAHALSSRRPINPGEGFVVDLSGVFNRYHANTARSFFYGEPGKDMLKMCAASRGGVEHFVKIAKVGASIADISRQMREYFVDQGVWNYRQYVGGYEQGIAFQPDWVGEWMFDIDRKGDQGVFEENTVSNFESVFVNAGAGTLVGAGAPNAGINIETILYEKDQTLALSNIALDLIVVG